MATNSMKGRGKREEIVAVIEVPLSEKSRSQKTRPVADDFQQASSGDGGAAAAKAASTRGVTFDANQGDGPELTISPVLGPLISGQAVNLQAWETIPDVSGSEPQDVTMDTTWRVLPTGALTTIDQSNSQVVLHPVNDGTDPVAITIRADYSDEDCVLTATTTVNVMPAVPSTIVVTPSTSPIPLGTFKNFTATGADAKGNPIP